VGSRLNSRTSFCSHARLMTSWRAQERKEGLLPAAVAHKKTKRLITCDSSALNGRGL
jgi:hypothetical protein